MKKLIIKHSERGAALIIVLAMVLAFSILGVTVSHYISTETATTRQTIAYLQARYLAEAGVEKGMYEIKKSLQNSGSSLRTYNFSLYGWPGGNSILPGANLNASHGVPNSLVPTDLVSYSAINTVVADPSDSRWIPAYLDPAGNNTTYSWIYPNPGGDTFSLKGRFFWSYYTPDDGINSAVKWQRGTSEGDFATVIPGDYPDVIYFYRTFIGTGQVEYNGKIVTRKIKVRASFSFNPIMTPDSPVMINIVKWEDFYG